MVMDEQSEDTCVEKLSHVPSKFSYVAQRVLEAPIMGEELTSTVQT
jgi:hypothetical protein